MGGLTNLQIFVIIPLVVIASAFCLYQINNFYDEMTIQSYVETIPPPLTPAHVDKTQYSYTNPNPYEVDLTHIFINWDKQVGRGGYSRVFLGRKITLPFNNSAQSENNSELQPSQVALISADPIKDTLASNEFDLAVKVIHKARYFRESQDPTSRKLTRVDPTSLMATIHSERDAWAAFSSPPIPGVLPLSHILQDANALYYISPLVLGSDLDLVTNRFGPVSEYTVRRWAATIINALEGIHARGYVYKDIKLKNLLLNETGHLHVIDFGLSRRAEQTDYDNDKIINCVTQGVRGRAGTKSYKAPEVLDGKGHSYPSDFYSLGVVLYKILTGHKLYHSDTDSPTLGYQPVIPKYHTYRFKQPRWKSWPVYETFSNYQQRMTDEILSSIRNNNNHEYHYEDDSNKHYIDDNGMPKYVDVLNHTVQRDITTHILNNYMVRYQQHMKDNGRNTNNKNNKDIDLGDSKDIAHKTITELYKNQKTNNTNNKNDNTTTNTNLLRDKNGKPNYQHNNLYYDGAGPMFTPSNKIDTQKNTHFPHHDGRITQPFAWLSLTDDCVDFLTQLVTLNPFYRLGTPNRLSSNDFEEVEDSSEDNNNDNKKENQNQNNNDNDQIEVRTTGEDSQANNNNKEEQQQQQQPPRRPYIPQTCELHDFSHTQVVLLDPTKPFSYKEDVIGIAASHPDPTRHCFPQYLDLKDPVPNFKKRDKNGRWMGLHSGYVEIRNHPFFKTFNWETMQDEDPLGKQPHVEEERLVATRFDIRNNNQKWPKMIHPKDDKWDSEKYQWVFDGLDFNTKP